MKRILTTFLLVVCFFVVSCSSTTTVTTDDGTTTQTPTTTETTLVESSTTIISTEAPTTTQPTTLVPTTLVPTTTTVTTTELIVDTDPPFVIEMANDSLKILQLTDLHLKYSADDSAGQTLTLIQQLVNSDTYDLVVITGDLTLSPSGPAYFLQLIQVMEGLETPWSFVFGNHEEDYNDYTEFLDVIPETEYLYFRVGPELDGGGYGNFVIQFQKDGVPFYDMIMMDSHAEREDFTPAEGRYDYLKESQVDWYKERVEVSTVNNLVFMHIPLRQYLDTEGYVGEFNEYICPQGRDTGLYDALVLYGKTKGVFVGHDHVNDFYIERDGIILAYGRNTGFGGYGVIERGGRIIEISSTGELTLSLILESDVSS